MAWLFQMLGIKRSKPKKGGSVRETVEARERKNAGIIDPRTSLFIGNWDLIIMMLLLFTTLITPYEVIFMAAVPEVTTLFVINRIVDGSFIVDMYVQFNLAFQAPPDKGGGWVVNKTCAEPSCRRCIACTVPAYAIPAHAICMPLAAI